MFPIDALSSIYTKIIGIITKIIVNNAFTKFKK